MYTGSHYVSFNLKSYGKVILIINVSNCETLKIHSRTEHNCRKNKQLLKSHCLFLYFKRCIYVFLGWYLWKGISDNVLVMSICLRHFRVNGSKSIKTIQIAFFHVHSSYFSTCGLSKTAVILPIPQIFCNICINSRGVNWEKAVDAYAYKIYLQHGFLCG